MNQLAEALTEKQGDMSLRALARELDVATGTAEGWVKGWRMPDLKHVPRIAEFLGVETGEVVSWLLADLNSAKGRWRGSYQLAPTG